MNAADAAGFTDTARCRNLNQNTKEKYFMKMPVLVERTFPVRESDFPFTIAIDSREQVPFMFNFSGIPLRTERRGLRTGDYSICGLEKVVCVERKSKADFFGSVSKGRERFEREFERMAQMKRACLVCESSQDEILNGLTNSRMDPFSVLRTAVSWAGRYRIPFFFCSSRKEAEWVTAEFLRFAWLEFVKNAQ